MRAAALILLLSLGPRNCGETPGGGAIRDTGRMNAERAAHTATLLNDGRVLIAGGFSGGSLSSAEVYDPESQRFTFVGGMRAARAGHTATLLPDGRVLIAGGFNGDYLASCEIFDPRTRQFTPAGELAVARSGHAAVLLRNGKVLLAGGVGTGWSFLRSAEIYEPSTGTSRPTGDMSAARESHTATLLNDGRVFVAGGHEGRRPRITLHAAGEIYDPAKGAFTAAGTMSIPRHKHDAVLLPDGQVLVTGGSDARDGEGKYDSAEVFDPKTVAFQRVRASHLPRFKHQGTSLLLRNQKVVVLGGAAQAELYDPASGRFLPVAGRFDEPRFFAAATLLRGGNALITGGYTEDQRVTARAWVYDP
jgi:hypothetical protein